MSGNHEFISTKSFESEGDESTIYLQGVVDENTDLSLLEDARGVKSVDLSHVSRINAAGQLRLLRLRLRSGGQIRFLASPQTPALIFSEMLNGCQ